MNHKGTVTIETERLILRRFTIDDAQAAFDTWTSDDEVTRYLTWPTHTSVEGTKGFLNWVIDSYNDPSTYQWAVVLKDTNQLVGNISVVHMTENIDAMEIGWVLGKAFWGRGIMPEAARGVFRYLFEETGVNRISARHDVRNSKSGRAMQKAGMTFEGVNRCAGRNNSGICDIAVYSILKNEL